MVSDNHTIVIMGGTSGIGLATAQLAVNAGANVWITGREQAKAETVQSVLGPTVHVRIFDASDTDATRAFFTEVGPFDHLVLTLSGGKGAGAFTTIVEQDIREGFDAKFFLHWNLAQASLTTLRKDGSITFVTAASARMGNPGTAGLAAINGAIQALVKPLAAELKPIRVNAVSPGIIETSWWNRPGEETSFDALKRMAEATPAGRLGHPEEVASAILFLVSNAFVTGTVLDCDGGIRLQ